MKNNTAANEWLPRLIIYSLLLLPALWIVPNYLRAKAGGKFNYCQGNLKELGTALEMYATENGGHYPEELSKAEPEYIKAIPTCPAARKDTYSSSYRVSKDRKRYTFYCHGRHHRYVGITEENWPQYNSTEGLKARP